MPTGICSTRNWDSVRSNATNCWRWSTCPGRSVAGGSNRADLHGGSMRNTWKLTGVCAGLFVLTNLDAAPKRKSRYALANGITIAYESFGSPDRETVLLIAGTGMQLTGWPVQLREELVRRGYRVVIYDNRDAGLSTKCNAAGVPDLTKVMQAAADGKSAPLPYTLYDMARDAVALLDALAIRKAHIAGVSMGGMI